MAAEDRAHDFPKNTHRVLPMMKSYENLTAIFRRTIAPKLIGWSLFAWYVLANTATASEPVLRHAK
jgi:hypothetical protein